MKLKHVLESESQTGIIDVSCKGSEVKKWNQVWYKFHAFQLEVWYEFLNWENIGGAAFKKGRIKKFIWGMLVWDIWNSWIESQGSFVSKSCE